ncbi:unnamed protein product [Cuscuta epithymum]|uniref:Uncharacterized protein n=1 Tax=Cuscuta epithymum TaxID=186058 RepID=A0AAV0CI09_9ASTE|nr:unnamed protein product [Cuscuta epithymum]
MLGSAIFAEINVTDIVRPKIILKRCFLQFHSSAILQHLSLRKSSVENGVNHYSLGNILAEIQPIQTDFELQMQLRSFLTVLSQIDVLESQFKELRTRVDKVLKLPIACFPENTQFQF